MDTTQGRACEDDFLSWLCSFAEGGHSSQREAEISQQQISNRWKMDAKAGWTLRGNEDKVQWRGVLSHQERG